MSDRHTLELPESLSETAKHVLSVWLDIEPNNLQIHLSMSVIPPGMTPMQAVDAWAKVLASLSVMVTRSAVDKSEPTSLTMGNYFEQLFDRSFKQAQQEARALPPQIIRGGTQ